MSLCTRYNNSNILLLNFRRNPEDYWEEKSDLQSFINERSEQYNTRSFATKRLNWETGFMLSFCIMIHYTTHLLFKPYGLFNSCLNSVKWHISLSKEQFTRNELTTVYTKRIDSSDNCRVF